MEPIKYTDRELWTLDNRLTNVESKMTLIETNINTRLIEIQQGNDKLEDKFDDKFKQILDKMEKLKDESVFAKGFIKAILISSAIISFAVTVLIKMH